MKTHLLHMTFLLLWQASIMLICSCDVQDPTPGDSIHELHINTIPSIELPSHLADTITPPANPMAPEDIDSYLTFRGKLTLDYFGSELYASLQMDNNSYFLLDHTRNTLIRLDHSSLTPHAVGDTIIVTGKLFEFLVPNELSFGITTYFVQQ